MSGTPPYVPDARLFLQLKLGGPTGPVDCTAWMAARLAAGHSLGKVMVSGRAIRLASDEPRPDPTSPGLNLGQVDTALRRLTVPDIDLDTRLGIADHEAQRMVIAGRWMGLQVRRSVLVAHDLGGPSNFGGGHAVTVHSADGVPVLGDSLIPYYQRTSWPVIWAAAAALDLGSHNVGQGRAYATFTRDVTREYRVVIHPEAPRKRQAFNVYTVSNGHVTGRVAEVTRGFSATCTPPRLYPWPGHASRSLVQVTSGFLGPKNGNPGKWLSAKWAEELP